MIVQGPAGVGKSSLLSAAAAALGDEAGLTTLSAHGSELESALPFGVAGQAPHRASPEWRSSTSNDRRSRSR